MNAPIESCHEGFRPGRLWSLLEMLERHVFFFVNATMALDETKWIASGFHEKHAGGPLARKNIADKGKFAIHLLRPACIYADMDNIIPQIDRLDQSLDRLLANPEYSLETVAQEIKALVLRIRDDLNQEFFFHLDGRDVPLFIGAELFGPKVTKKMPKTVEDIAEAGKCLALHQGTACVFHLMRVMELGVHALARKLKVETIDPKIDTWNKILDHTHGRINALPAKTAADKARKAKLAEAYANLNAVRIAWRNEVMHPKQTYSREEAHDVFNATRAFMDHLAGLI